MEYDAIKHATQDDGGLFDLGWYLSWIVGQKEATLDGRFTAEELRQIARWMDTH